MTASSTVGPTHRSEAIASFHLQRRIDEQADRFSVLPLLALDRSRSWSPRLPLRIREQKLDVLAVRKQAQFPQLSIALHHECLRKLIVVEAVVDSAEIERSLNDRETLAPRTRHRPETAFFIIYVCQRRASGAMAVADFAYTAFRSTASDVTVTPRLTSRGASDA